MYFKNWLNLQEVHYEDFYGSKFVDFRKKYLKFKNDPYLFVNFSNYARDILEKTPFKDPSHRDPVGIYGYPLKYVVDYPSDIWYAANAKYLRILKLNTSNASVLRLQNMDLNYAETLLRKAGLDINYLKMAQKTFKFSKGAGQVGKQFFQSVQHDFSKLPTRDDYNYAKYPLRSGIEQTAILQKMGINVLIDDAKVANQAVINDREPAQVIFLSRNSFEITEMFFLGEKFNKDHISTARSSLYNDVLARKLASMILVNLNDQIIERSTLQSESSNVQTYYSKLGRMITINFGLPQYYYQTRKIGEKKHKETKLSDLYQVTIEMYGEREHIKLQYYSNEKFEKISKDFANYYNKKDLVSNFKPYTLQRSLEEKSKAEEEYRTKEREKRKKQEQQEEIDFQPLLQELLNTLNINLRLSVDKPWFKNLLMFHNLSYASDKTKEKSSDEIIKETFKKYELLYEDRDGFFKSNDPDSIKFIEMYKKLLDMPDSDFRRFRHISSYSIKEAIDYYKNNQ